MSDITEHEQPVLLILRQVVNTWADVASLDIPGRYRAALVNDLLWQWPVTMKFAIDALQNMADHADNPEGFNQNEGDAWRDGIEAAIRTIRLGGWRDRP